MFTRFAFTDAVSRTVSSDGSWVMFEGLTNSGKSFAISVRLSDANRWLNGESIQNCFKYLDTEQREILMTGNDNESWEALFG